MTIILISVVGMIVNSGGIAVSNVQATANEFDKTQSSNDNAGSSDNSTTQTFSDELPPSDDNNKAQTSNDNIQTFSDELPPSDDNNKAQTSDDSNEVISTNQELLPGLEQSNPQVLRFEETPLQTFDTSTKDLQNPNIKSDVNQKATSSQNDSSQIDLRSNYLAKMPVYNGVKDCYKSDGILGFDGQWSCAGWSCTVKDGGVKEGDIKCIPNVQGTTNDDNDKAKQIGTPFYGECKEDKSGENKCYFK